MKKLIYIANVRIPTEKANGIQIMKMCEAFSRYYDVELWLPWRNQTIQMKNINPFEYYNIKYRFIIKKLPSTTFLIKFPILDRLSFFLQWISFSIFVLLYSLFNKADIFYGRDELSLLFISLFNKNVFYEMHNFNRPRIFTYKLLFKKIKGLVLISDGLKSKLLDKNILPRKYIIAHDAVDINMFKIRKSKNECRKILNLPLNKKIVVYTGRLTKEKGVFTLIEAAKKLPSIYFYFVGGFGDEIEEFKNFAKQYSNIIIIGFVEYKIIPYYLKAADLLVIPNSAKYEESYKYTSPLKLFEYLASGTSIIASDVKSIKDILKDNVVYFEADNSKSIIKSIKSSINSNINPKGRLLYDWRLRAKKIYSFCNSI